MHRFDRASPAHTDDARIPTRPIAASAGGVASSPPPTLARGLLATTAQRARDLAGRWTELSRFVLAPALCTERMTLSLAEDLEAAGPGRLQPDDDEELDVVRMHPRDLLLGRHLDAKTQLVAALLHLGAT